MADEADIGNQLAEHFMSLSLKTKLKAEGPDKLLGLCYACGKEVSAHQRWCDAECRDDWEAKQKDPRGQ